MLIVDPMNSRTLANTIRMVTRWKADDLIMGAGQIQGALVHHEPTNADYLVLLWIKPRRFDIDQHKWAIGQCGLL